jgi:hypothetical protein
MFNFSSKVSGNAKSPVIELRESSPKGLLWVHVKSLALPQFRNRQLLLVGSMVHDLPLLITLFNVVYASLPKQNCKLFNIVVCRNKFKQYISLSSYYTYYVLVKRVRYFRK